MDRQCISVTELNNLIKGLLDQEPSLSNVCVRGELSNYKIYPSGHHYFTLKDSESSLRCVMFKSSASKLRFRPENGMQVIAAGRVTVFPRDGQYQLYCTRLTPEGVGDLYLAFEQLKEKLTREGLFDQGHKKPIPAFPDVIALVTSPAGAAVRDMVRILRARWPMTQVKILPVRVQGAGAAEEIAAAIRWANENAAAQLIITGRGGGSMEDLWAFNEEIVARAIYHSEIPVISAVGHEPDVTISDFVADLRASTPSNAAELAVPQQEEIRGSLTVLDQRLQGSMDRRLSNARRLLNRLASSRAMMEPGAYFKDKRLLLDYQSQRLTHALERSVSAQREHLGKLSAALDAMSPLKVLGRGYSIALKEGGGVIASVKDAMPGEKFVLKVSDGQLACQIDGSTKREE